jgi:hypothetical protein
MKKTLWIFAALMACQFAAAQDVSMKLRTRDKGYSYDAYPFPNDLIVSSLDRQKHHLQVTELTLIHVWSLCCGTSSDMWNRIEDMGLAYRDLGLKTISINFENGMPGKIQRQELAQFFKNVKEPENFYYDPMAGVVELLKVPGIPTYFLVDETGMVVFRTLGEDREGVKLLEEQIYRRLKESHDR